MLRGGNGERGTDDDELATSCSLLRSMAASRRRSFAD